VATTLVDVSHVVADGTITYPGIPAPVITDHLSRQASRARYAPGTEFQMGKIEMIANTGTYVDAPFHRYADGADLSQLSLERVADLDRMPLPYPLFVKPVAEGSGKGIFVNNLCNSPAQLAERDPLVGRRRGRHAAGDAIGPDRDGDGDERQQDVEQEPAQRGDHRG